MLCCLFSSKECIHYDVHETSTDRVLSFVCFSLQFPMMEEGTNKVKKKAQVVKCAVRISQPQQDSCLSWVVCIAGVMSNVIVCGFAFSYGIVFPAILNEFHEGKAKTGTSICIFLSLTLNHVSYFARISSINSFITRMKVNIGIWGQMSCMTYPIYIRSCGGSNMTSLPENGERTKSDCRNLERPLLGFYQREEDTIEKNNKENISMWHQNLHTNKVKNVWRLVRIVLM